MDTLGHATSNSGVLAGYVSRLESLYGDRDVINTDIKEVYGEAREAGFSVGILRIIVAERRMEQDARQNRYILLESYRHQLGMLADLPLGQAAIEAASLIPAKRPGRPRKQRAPADPRVEVAPSAASGYVPPTVTDPSLGSQARPLEQTSYYRPPAPSDAA